MPKTIRLLSTYNGNPPGTILTNVADSIADQLLFGGVNATLDLTGGTPYVPPPVQLRQTSIQGEINPTGQVTRLVGPDGSTLAQVGANADTMRKLRLALTKGFQPQPLAPVSLVNITGSGWAPAATAASTTLEQIFTVPAMQPGDMVVSITPPSALPTNLQIRSFRWVSSTQVGITLRNTTAGPLTAPTGDYTVRIARFFGGLPPDAPTVTMSAAAAVSSLGAAGAIQTFLGNSTNVRMRHPYVINGSLGGGGIYAQSAAVSIVGAKVGYLMGVEFMTDAPKFEIVTTAYSQTIRVLVDGKIASAAPIVMSFKNDVGYRLLVDFTQGGTITTGTRKARKIRVEMGGNCHFGGVTVTKADSVWVPIDANAVKGLVLGDSYIQGTPTQNPLIGLGSANYDGMANIVGDLLGWDENVVTGLASTGYLANTGTTAGTSPRWGARMSDFTGPQPNVILAFGSINDQTFTTTALEAEVTAFWTQMVAALPNTIMFVTGLQSPKDSQNVANWNTAVKNGVAAVGSPNLFFIDMRSPTPWVFGTGDAATPTGNGNADVITGTDTIHPSMEGHVYYAYKLADAIRAIIKSFLG